MGKVTSIVTDNLKTCFICGMKATEIHHCLHGYSNRKWAEKYHLVVGLCHSCHRQVHDSNHAMDLFLQQSGQQAFEKEHPDLNFRQIFGKNYL